MPPKTATTKVQYPVQEPGAEVLCPITPPGGTKCRKRCLGEKRYRSIQEHIRRAHPEHYLPRLPATKESFDLMVNTPPHEVLPKPEQPEWSSPPSSRDQPTKSRANGQTLTPKYYHDEMSLDYLRATGPYRRESHSAAAVLAQLHYTRPDGDWRTDSTLYADEDDDDDEDDRRMSIEDPTLSAGQRLLDSPYIHDVPSPRHRTFAHAVQKIHPRSAGQSRRSSPTPNKRSKLDRLISKDLLRPLSYGGKLGSLEPLGKSRWEDLIDAATSVAEEDSREATPLPTSPFRSPSMNARPSFTPQLGNSRSETRAGSPLQRTLSPVVRVANDNNHPDGQAYLNGTNDDYISPLDTSKGPQAQMFSANLPPSNLTVSSTSDSSTTGQPSYGNHAVPSSTPVQIYCAGCRSLSVLRDSYACTECISGLCAGCVDALLTERARGRLAAQCPQCRSLDGQFKLFQLDIR